MQNMKISHRILIGFGLILVLLVGLSTYAVMTIGNVAGVFTEYRSAAKETVSASEITAGIYVSRGGALKYRLAPNAEQAARVQESLDSLVTISEERADDGAGASVSARQIALLLPDIRTYRAQFEALAQIQAEISSNQSDLRETGSSIRKTLSDLRASAHGDGDIEAAYEAASTTEALLLGRLYMEKFLIGGVKSDFDQAQARLEEARAQIAKLDAALQNPGRREMLAAFDTGLARYDALSEQIGTLIADRDAIAANELDVIGPNVQSALDELMKKDIAIQNTLGPEAAATFGQISSTVQLADLVHHPAQLLGHHLDRDRELVVLVADIDRRIEVSVGDPVDLARTFSQRSAHIAHGGLGLTDLVPPRMFLAGLLLFGDVPRRVTANVLDHVRDRTRNRPA
ncbi:MAG: hypothetical protein AAFR79_16260, partial [Pseudomonadota bacterium]